MNFIIKKTKNHYCETFLWLFFAVFIFSLSHAVWASEINSENVIKLVNEARQVDGVGTLMENEKLTQAAESKADDMIANNYFAHTSPTGITPWFWIEKYNYDYESAGENLAMNFTQAENQEEAWMKSENHRKNILNPIYKEIGVAVKKGMIKGQMTIVTVQMFGTTSRGAIAVNQTPQKDIEVSKEPAQNFTRANDVAINLNGGPGVESLVAQYSIPDNQKAAFENNMPAVFYRNQDVVTKSAWAISILVLLIVLAVNFVSLSKMHERSASPVVNAAILIIMLSAIVFFR